jgi:serine/threonine protein kinase
VLEPLSEPIRKLLLELKLCSENDLRRCRRHVRRLTCNLPAFDSVWLDALVQIGRLTPFQARLLESPDRRTIEVGPCVAIDRLGSGRDGPTLLTRMRDGHELCVTKILHSSGRLSEETVERLHTLLERVKDFGHPSIVAPITCARINDQIVLVSRYIPGTHLAELVIRRGRFPARIVLEIGRQLAEGLAALADRGVAHGDIRLANVRLMSSGTAVLVDTGVRPAIDPLLTIHAGLPPDRYDGIAPELIAASVSPNARSDAYALGCLLWQLLAGRPPFPGGDPLIKLAAHQTRSIDDIRQWAPDTPSALAEGIRRLTAREVSERPEDLLEILKVWQGPGRTGRARLASFRRNFDTPVRTPRTGWRLSTPTRWLMMLATLFAVSGAAVTLSDRGARNVALAWAAQFSQALNRENPEREVLEEMKSWHPVRVGEDAATFEDESMPATGRVMPAPDRYGVIHLEASGPWHPSEITAVGELTIAGDGDPLPEIVIGKQPLRLWAEKVTLRNVRIVSDPATAAAPPKRNALVLVQAQELAVEGCIFDVGRVPAGKGAHSTGPATAPPTGPALLAWKLLDAAEQRGGRASIRNTILSGDGPGLYLAHAVRHVGFDNVLKTGTGPLVQLAAAPAVGSETVLQMNRTTCRASGALLRWVVPAEGSPAGGVLIEAGECVFDVVSPGAALLEFAGAAPRLEWLPSVRMTGEGSVVRPDLEVAAWISTDDGSCTFLESAGIALEGIFAGPFRFTGPPGPAPFDAEVVDCEAPRRGIEPPGILARALPGARGSADGASSEEAKRD